TPRGPVGLEEPSSVARASGSWKARAFGWPTRCALSSVGQPIMTAASSPSVSWCCSQLTPAMHGCSTARISWPHGSPETASSKQSISRRPIPRFRSVGRAAIASTGRRSSTRIGKPVGSSPSLGIRPTKSLLLLSCKFQICLARVMGALPRHEFVPEDLRPASYADRPLPIGYGQTISQPLIVALMTDVLNVDQSSVVLEVGTGSGYQAAVVAELARQVYTIEIIPDLARNAADRLRRLGYTNVTVRVGDGYFGWPEAAPFDGIIVAAAAGHVPQPLLQQLKPDGRMVIPIGPPFGLQHLTVVQRGADGRVTTH